MCVNVCVSVWCVCVCGGGVGWGRVKNVGGGVNTKCV